MGHEIEVRDNVGQMVFATEDGDPWHQSMTNCVGLELHKLDLNAAHAAMVQAVPTLGSTYSLSPAYRFAGEQPILIPETYSVSRDVDGLTLQGTVGGQFDLWQPEAVYRCMAEIAADSGANLTAAGYLREGSRLFVCGKLPGKVDLGGTGDTMDRYITVLVGFDGTLSRRLMLSYIRSVCWNTVQAAMRDARLGDGDAKAYRAVKNTRNADTRIQDAIADFRKLLTEADFIESRLQAMTQVKVTNPEAADLISRAFGVHPDSLTDPKKEKEKAAASVLDIYHNRDDSHPFAAAGFSFGAGLATTNGTLFGVHQAVGGFLDWNQRLNGARTKDKGLESAADIARVFDSQWNPTGVIFKAKARFDKLADSFLVDKGVEIAPPANA